MMGNGVQNFVYWASSFLVTQTTENRFFYAQKIRGIEFLWDKMTDATENSWKNTGNRLFRPEKYGTLIFIQPKKNG